MKKVIILPTYKDKVPVHMQWWKKYISEPSLGELLIYQKDDNVEASSETVKVSKNVYKIPNIGRSSYAFIRYVCDNYENLADIVCLVKPHALGQKVAVDFSISRSHNFEYLEFWNDLRTFIWMHPDAYQKQIKMWNDNNFNISEQGDWSHISHHLSLRDLGLYKLAIKYLTWDIEPAQKIYVSAERWNGAVGDKLREIWPDWKIPVVMVARQEACWSVTKELILRHPKELYERMRDEVFYDKSSYPWAWGLHHDQWGEFWSLFWRKNAELQHDEMKKQMER